MVKTTTLLLALLGGVDVEVILTNGTTQVGRLDSLNNQSAALSQAGDQRVFPLSQLDRIRFNASVPRRVSSEAVLTDGSQIAITEFTTSAGTATLDRPQGSQKIVIPQRSLRAVRLMALNGTTLESWDAMLADPPKMDVVVIRRRDNRLQQIDGTLGDIDESSVRFQFDGDWIDVQRTKIAGVMYVSPATTQNGLARGQLAMRDGSHIQLQDINFGSTDLTRAADKEKPTGRVWEGEAPAEPVRQEPHPPGDVQFAARLTLSTPNGTRMDVAISQIRYIDFAAVSTVYLSALKPERMQVQPFVRIPALAEEDAIWLQPQNDRSLSRQPLALRSADGKQRFEKGLGLHSRTELLYRLAGKYRRFRALAAVDETGGPGRLALVISTDGEERFHEMISVGDPAREIDIDLTGVNRLRILVDYGDESDQGDQISLCDARFLK